MFMDELNRHRPLGRRTLSRLAVLLTVWTLQFGLNESGLSLASHAAAQDATSGTAVVTSTGHGNGFIPHAQTTGIADTSFPPRTVDGWFTPAATWTSDPMLTSQVPQVNNEYFYVGKQSPITVLPSYSRLTYGDGSIKNRGSATGIYASLSHGVRLLEGSYDDTDILFRSGFKLHQRDYTVKYTDFWAEGVGYSIGGHFIQSNDITTDKVNVLITGLQWYEVDRWNADLDFFVSSYEEFRPDVTVLQLSARYGRYRTKTDHYSVRTEVAGHYINTSEDIIGQQHLFSGELRYAVESGRMGLSLFGWVGQQVFPVRNGGFLVFNLGDERVGGYGAEVRTSLTRNGVLIGRLNNEHVRDTFTRSLTNQLVASVLYSFTF